MSSPPRHGPSVQWIPNCGAGDALPHPSSHLISERFTAWLVIVLLLASAGLALYDLYLLISGLQ